MAEATTYKIVEVAGTSTESIAEAMRSGVEASGGDPANLDRVEVKVSAATSRATRLPISRSETKIGFRLDEAGWTRYGSAAAARVLLPPPQPPVSRTLRRARAGP